jgi:serine phosphatase RsbU (regulator of sigma subunit)
MTHKNFRLILLTVFLLLTAATLEAQSVQPLAVTADGLAGDKKIALDESWTYRAGDDLVWANANFDDSVWKTKNDVSPSDWHGIAWARIHLNVADDLAGVPLNLEMRQTGASEIYLDGKLLGGFGKVGRTPAEEQTFSSNFMPFGIVFEKGGEHVIAVRFSNQYAADLNSYSGKFFNVGAPIGFTANLARLGASTNAHLTNNLSFGYWMIQIAVCLSIGILHLLLFAFYPKQRANLFYSLFVLTIMLSALTLVLSNYSHFQVYLYTLSGVGNALLTFPKYCLLLIFLYTAFGGKIPRRIWFFVIGFAVNYFLLFSGLVSGNNLIRQLLYAALTLGANLEATRIVISAARKKMDGAWIVLPGVITRAFIGVLDALSTSSNSVSLILLKELYYPYFDFIGTYGLILSISIYLARQFAQTNSHLEAQLVNEVEHEKNKARLLIVEAENKRRAQELEEARQLQLSMLPKKLPAIPNLEIAAYMKTATEVGGDYYDFHVSPDGTLTVAVGDATGHGLKAGTVVTATKSLFNNLAAAPDIPDTLRQISRSLKAMNLRGLFMALTLIKLKDNHLSICAAGMPSTLVYRALTQTVEEISIRALPLGSMTKFNYRGQELSLQTGDCVVVMSDGFQEMFNPANEMLGFEKAAAVLKEIAARAPQEIIDRFVEVSRKWANERPADDDVTFVVLKIV